MHLTQSYQFTDNVIDAGSVKILNEYSRTNSSLLTASLGTSSKLKVMCDYFCFMAI